VTSSRRNASNSLEAKRFQQPQNLDELPLASLAQARFEQPTQHTEAIGQLPARQRRRLVERTRLLLEWRPSRPRGRREHPSVPPARIAMLSSELGPGGVGLYHDFVHLDSGPRRFWTG
jgi:hypothetical protein